MLLPPVHCYTGNKAVFIDDDLISTAFPFFLPFRYMCVCVKIDDFGELEKLQAFRNLRILNLEFNPIHSLPYYRWHVIMRLPFLRMLDNKNVTDKERAKASSIVRKEETTLDLMATNEVLIAKLKHGIIFTIPFFSMFMRFLVIHLSNPSPSPSPLLIL
jgi:hypothetical protein